MSAATGLRGRAPRAWLAGLALAALLGGCGDSAPPPLAPAPPPPGVAEVFPTGRATRVPFDVVAWARFDTPLDSTTVNDRTVFFKLDTRRIPVEVRWESAANRILVRPLEQPSIGRTHTVVLSTAIRTAGGAPLAQPYEWQFRMLGVRTPDPQYPAAGATYESPFASPEWAATEAAAGDIVYEFYAGEDSMAVVARAMPPKRVMRASYFLPDTAWALGSRRWWSVTTVNRTLGERVDGPAVWFAVVPPGTPVDSSGVAITQYGHRNAAGFGNCTVAQILAGPGYVTGIRWNRAAITGRRLAAARIETNTSDTLSMVELLAPDQPFDQCQLRYPGPPYPDPLLPVLAVSTRARGTRRLVYRSALLTAQIERVLRRQDFSGYLLKSARFTDLLSVNFDPTFPLIRVVHYVVPPSAKTEAPAGTPVATPAVTGARVRPTLDPSLTPRRRDGRSSTR